MATRFAAANQRAPSVSSFPLREFQRAAGRKLLRLPVISNFSSFQNSFEHFDVFLHGNGFKVGTLLLGANNGTRYSTAKESCVSASSVTIQ